MNTNAVCETCIRLVKDVCGKNQQPPLEDQTCRFYIEKGKADLKDIEIARLRTEVERLKKLLPSDPTEELLTRLLPKLKIALEKNFLTNYSSEEGKQVQILDSFNYKKLKDLNLVAKQQKTVTYTKDITWFTSEFEAKIRERLAEAQ